MDHLFVWIALLMAPLLICASLGSSATAVWMGCDLVLFMGISLWMVFGLVKESSEWAEAALVAQLLSPLVPLASLYFRNKPH